MENAGSRATEADAEAAVRDEDDGGDAGVAAPRARRSVFASAGALRAAYLAIGALAIGLVFWRLQFSTDAICCGDLDGYYHIGWSQQLWQAIRSGRFPPQFTWLPLT